MRALSKQATTRFETLAEFKAALARPRPRPTHASIVRKATRLVSALPASFTMQSPALASSADPMEEPAKSSIPPP